MESGTKFTASLAVLAVILEMLIRDSNVYNFSYSYTSEQENY